MERSEAEIAWAAGLFEGEGCVSGTWDDGYYHPIVLLQMTDMDAVQKFHKIIGFGHFHGPWIPKQGRKSAYGWRSHTWNGTVDLYNLLSKWLCVRRDARFKEIFSFYKPRQPSSNYPQTISEEDTQNIEKKFSEGYRLIDIQKEYNITWWVAKKFKEGKGRQSGYYKIPNSKIVIENGKAELKEWRG